MLMLCGSAQTFMNDLGAGSAPLHQRFTEKITLSPLGYRDAAKFTPQLSASECLRVYGVLGGTPLYLRAWDGAAPFRDNLLQAHLRGFSAEDLYA